jgi:DNA-binding PadR family transcriptional regulator
VSDYDLLGQVHVSHARCRQAGGEVEVSPVFRHGRLRLYLLKLLDESPRHGYEVIRLLQDRFMGIYAPSPGTIYPRLARLEEDGLVTHEEVDGKKVYSITDKGREEIRSRLGDLADLEDELTESLRDVAREISEDVRDTVRTIREELASAAREFRADPGRSGAGRAGAGRAGAGGAGAGRAGAGGAGAGRAGASAPGANDPGAGGRAGTTADGEAAGGTAADDAAGSKAGSRAGGEAGASGSAGTGATHDGGSADAGEEQGAASESRRIRDEARRRREQMRASFRAQGRGHSDWAAWQGWGGRSEGSPWGAWADWMGESGPAAGSGAGSSESRSSESRSGAGMGFAPGGQRSRRGGPNPFSDLERMAIQFATELRSAAKQAGDIGERSLSDLRDILTDTLAKVRVEVFTDTDPGKPGSEDTDGGDSNPRKPDPDAAAEPSNEASGEASATDAQASAADEA